jgi:hypothetical protein
MTGTSLVLATCSSVFSRLLLKYFLNVDASDLKGELVDIAGSRIKDFYECRKAVRYFEDLADKMCCSLAPIFDQPLETNTLNVNAVVTSLSTFLSSQLTVSALVANDLDIERLETMLAKSPEFRPLGFSEAELQLFQRSVTLALRFIVDTASTFPHFEEAYCSEYWNVLPECLNT